MNSRRFPKRSTAYKLSIEDIKGGDYFVEKRQDREISYIVTPFGLKVNRVRILGDVILIRKYPEESQDNPKSIYLRINDGTEDILVRVYLQSQFNNKYLESIKIAKDLEKGNLVDVIGRIRKKEDNIYIVPEIIKKVEDPNIETLRDLEKTYLKLKWKKNKLAREEKPVTLNEPASSNVQDVSEDDFEDKLEAELTYTASKSGIDGEKINSILSLIEKLDEGEGVSIEEISTYTNIDKNKLEKTIRQLFEDGTIYERKSGRYKIL
ncbi:MAG: hypothetical protein ACTSVY_07630 [Candidatus Helarchaeota archaeon]